MAPIYGFRSAALRFFTVYGPRQRPDLAIHAFARRMADGEVLTLFGDGTQSRDYTYCDDIVAGVVAAVDWTGERPGRHGGVQPGRQPDRADRRHGGGDRRGPWGSSPRSSGRRCSRATCSSTAADLTKSGAVLGYAPKTPFPEGIRRFVAWFREAHGRAD